jgi:hypothetical protein
MKEKQFGGCSHSPFVLMVIASLFAVTGCRGAATGGASAGPAPAPRVTNLRAFARLYGVVRWFHPSDAAAAIDWNQFAVEGARRIIDASDARALRAGLTELFAPIAPTVHVAVAGDDFPSEPALHPGSRAGLDVIAWQHEGYGDSIIAAGYMSKRRHRDREIAVEGALSAMLHQSVDATQYRGATIRLRGKLRTAHQAQGRLWLRVDRGETRVFFENMVRRPVMTKTWTAAEITATVDVEATRIAFGQVMSGTGTTWYDDLELAVQAKDGSWSSIEIDDGGFETADPLLRWRPGSGAAPQDRENTGWSIIVDRDAPASGASSLRVQRATTVLTEELFDDAPAPGEIVDIGLGGDLRARVPIALYSKGKQTIGDDPEAARRTATPVAIPAEGFDVVAGIADVIVVWNVLQHFWPYWDIVSVDWDSQLDLALADALDDRSVDDHVLTLRRLSAAAPDGHASTTCPGQTRRGFPPFSADIIEGQVVVTRSAGQELKRGDIIVAIDGQPSGQLMAAEQALVSGSPQWRRARAVEQLGRGPAGTKVELRVRRGAKELTVVVARLERSTATGPSHPPIERFDDGVYYIDLEQATMAEIDAAMTRIAAAPGVVFDMRVSPNGNHHILSHLLTRPDNASSWMAIPRVIRPRNASPIKAWSTSG